jgi:hypothetical protein
MDITATALKAEFKKVWPGIVFQWVPDTSYTVVSLEEMRKDIMECHSVEAMMFGGLKSDCDDFALELHTEMKQKSRLSKYPFHKPFGEAFGLKWRSQIDKHTANIFYCKKGVYLCDGQDKAVWKANSNDDLIYTVKL